MPDITMCPSETCAVRKLCYRNPESGTKPSDFLQSWFLSVKGDPAKGPGEDVTCHHYWLV